MLASLLAFVWLASLGSLAHAGVVTTTTTIQPASSTTSTTLDPTTTSTTVATTTSTTETTSTTVLATTTTSSTEITSTTTPASTTSTSTSSSSSTSLASSTTTVTSPTESSTSSSTSTSTPTSSSSSTTSTSVQPGAEQCFNCLDDDGDGLTDFEDPDCCLGAPGVLSVERLALKPIGAVTGVRLTLSGLPAVSTLSPYTQTLYLQLAPDDGTPIVCASVHAAHFKAKPQRAGFSDKTSGVPSARGLTAITLRRLGTGALQATVRGARAHFHTPAAQHVRVAVGMQSLVTPGTPVRCAVQTVDVTPDEKGTLETPRRARRSPPQR